MRVVRYRVFVLFASRYLPPRIHALPYYRMSFSCLSASPIRGCWSQPISFIDHTLLKRWDLLLFVGPSADGMMIRLTFSVRAMFF